MSRTAATAALAAFVVLISAAVAASAYSGYGTPTAERASGTASQKKPIGALRGTVGPGFTIQLAKGPKRAGLYKLVVTDKSGIHNFRLVATKAVTSVAGTGTKSFLVALEAGKTYTFLCDPHRTTMVGKFTVPEK
jgi:hypothetical protein